jgi:cellulose biosynthesis protein BcsQ
VLVVCWSPKGGVGTTVVAAALAVQRSADDAGAVLVDLAGDAPAVLGVPEPASPGLAGWLAAGDDVPADGLARIEVEATPGLGLLPRGAGPLEAGRAGVLAALLERSPRTTVVDCGRGEGAVAAEVMARAHRSLLVIRPCFLAVRRASRTPRRATGVVVVNEPGRTLSQDDVGAALGLPVVAAVEADPAVARLVDAGLLTARMPRSLGPLRAAA